MSAISRSQPKRRRAEGLRRPSFAPALLRVRIVTDSSLTEPVTRTWRERWLSWPWRPWARVKLVPSRTYYIVDSVPGGPKTLVCHPSLAAEFERALAEHELQSAIEMREGGKWWS